MLIGEIDRVPLDVELGVADPAVVPGPPFDLDRAERELVEGDRRARVGAAQIWREGVHAHDATAPPDAGSCTDVASTGAPCHAARARPGVMPASSRNSRYRCDWS